MPNDDQAEADLREDPTTGDDPAAQDASHDPENLGATDLDDYHREVAAILEQGDQPANEEEPAEEESSTEGEEEDAPDESPEEEEAEEDAPAEEEEEAEDTKAQSRFRIRASDDVEAEALALRKRHPDWSLKKCIETAETILGVKTADTDNEEEAPPPRSTADVTKELADVRAARKQALAEMEFEKLAELDDRIEDLRDEREELRLSEMQVQASKKDAESVRFDTEYEQSETRAVAHYPDCTNPESALVKKMTELDQRAKSLEDPIFFSPNKPFLLAQAAAKELGILMADPKAPKPPAKKQAAPRRPVPPASGSARTTEPADSATKLEKQIGGVQTQEDYDKLVSSLGAGSF